MKYGKIITFLGGMLMGTAGIAVLSSKDAKKAYTHATAAVIRGKDGVMKTVSTVKENCGDIYADAKDINAYGTLLITALTILSGAGNNIFET